MLGYAFSDSLHTDVVEDALRRAVAFRAPGTGATAGVIFHADRGCQYTSAQLARVADDLEVRLSRRPDRGVLRQRPAGELLVDPQDRVLQRGTTSPPTPRPSTPSASWIETVYNRRRRHSALGQISPVTFEHRITTAAAEAA